jgi:hypothetical protein
VRAFKPNYFDCETSLVPPEADVSLEMQWAEGTVSEDKVIARLPQFAGYGYSLAHPRYPYAMFPGFAPSALATAEAATKVNNCSSFTCGLLVKAWQEDVIPWLDEDRDLVQWEKGDRRYYEWMINGYPANATEEQKEAVRAARFSPISVAVEMGMAVDPVDARSGGDGKGGPAPHPWTLLQGFQNDEWDEANWATGHSFIIVDRYSVSDNSDEDLILTLESNEHYSMNGPGFRSIGDIDDVSGFSPGKDWFLRSGLPTWLDIKTAYKYLRMARLKINDLNWVR